jgi:hypothetical protein
VEILPFVVGRRLGELRHELRERGDGLGFDRAVRRATFAVEPVMRKGFERFYGVRMGGDVSLEDLGVDASDRVSYNPTSWIPLRRALKSIGPGPDDVFADLGSGKGKELIVASQFPFKRVVGVEFSADIMRLAPVNVEPGGGGSIPATSR